MVTIRQHPRSFGRISSRKALSAYAAHQDFATRVIDNVEQVIIGKRDSIELLMVALLCEGHVLIEDVPGVGKTMLARSIATSLGGQFKRVHARPICCPMM